MVLFRIRRASCRLRAVPGALAQLQPQLARRHVACEGAAR